MAFGSRRGSLADASSAASRSTSAMIRAFSAGGGFIAGADIGSAWTATLNSSTSAWQAAQVSRCAMKAARSSSGSAPSTKAPAVSSKRS